MKAMLVLMAAAGVEADAPMPPEIAKDRWQIVTHMCWEDTTPEGEPVSDIQVKVACITAGVLTQRLIDANYCLDATEAEWALLSRGDACKLAGKTCLRCRPTASLFHPGPAGARTDNQDSGDVAMGRSA